MEARGAAGLLDLWHRIGLTQSAHYAQTDDRNRNPQNFTTSENAEYLRRRVHEPQKLSPKLGKMANNVEFLSCATCMR